MVVDSASRVDNTVAASAENILTPLLKRTRSLKTEEDTDPSFLKYVN
jgi:hypothetical protein